MAKDVLQASDFQDQGVQGNLKTLESIVSVANNKKVSAMHLVGDLFDAHGLQEFLQMVGTPESKSFIEANPDIQGLFKQREQALKDLQAKYGNNLNQAIAEGKLKEGDLAGYIKAEKAINESGFLQAQEKDIGSAVRAYYGKQAGILGKYSNKIYVVPGNNDSKAITDIIKAQYPSLEQKMVEDGPFKIIGISNTNYEGEVALPQGMTYPNDGPNAYEVYSLKKTGKKANIIMLHGPPNGYRDGHDEPAAEGITKLIKEHKADGRYMLVECGHFHSGLLEEKDGVIYARSSPNVFFIHHFDDGGNYNSSTIYMRKQAIQEQQANPQKMPAKAKEQPAKVKKG